MQHALHILIINVIFLFSPVSKTFALENTDHLLYI